MLAFVDDRSLIANVGGKDIFCLVTALGAVLAVSRAFIIEEHISFAPSQAMARVVA